MANLFNAYNCKLSSQGSFEEAKQPLSFDMSPPAPKVKIMPGGSNQVLSCSVEKSPLPSIQGRKRQTWGQDGGNRTPSVLAEAAHTRKERGFSVYTHHVCLSLNKNLISQEYHTFHAQRSQTPSPERSGTCEEPVNSLDEDCCFELKRPHVAHLGSRNQLVSSFGLQRSSEAREITFLESTELETPRESQSLRISKAKVFWFLMLKLYGR